MSLGELLPGFVVIREKKCDKESEGSLFTYKSPKGQTQDPEGRQGIGIKWLWASMGIRCQGREKLSALI